jgi:hypothetical protein
MRRTGCRAALGLILLAWSGMAFVVSSRVPDGTPVYIGTWLGGVVLGASGIYALVVAFPVRDEPPIEPEEPEEADQSNGLPPPSD